MSVKATYISIRLELFTATNFSHTFTVWRQHQIFQLRQRFKDRFRLRLRLRLRHRLHLRLRLRLRHRSSDIRNLMMGKRSVFQPPKNVSLSYTADFLNI